MSGTVAMMPKDIAIIRKPMFWIAFRPSRSMYQAAMKYPGTAATTKTISCVTTCQIRLSFGWIAANTLGLLTVLP